MRGVSFTILQVRVKSMAAEVRIWYFIFASQHIPGPQTGTQARISTRNGRSSSLLKTPL